MDWNTGRRTGRDMGAGRGVSGRDVGQVKTGVYGRKVYNEVHRYEERKRKEHGTREVWRKPGTGRGKPLEAEGSQDGVGGKTKFHG